MRLVCYSFWSLLLLAIAPCLCAAPKGDADTLRVENLRCEYLRDPLGVDVARPRFSWTLHSNERGQRQLAYQLQAASARETLQSGKPDLWDSGKKNSAETLGIEYTGAKLASGQTCFWRVKVWDVHGQECSWSDPARFEMGLLDDATWHAQWITDGKSTPTRPEDFYKDDPAPLFRKPFSVPKPLKRARLYITGLGYYEAFLNGQRVGDHQLDPLWTTYSKRVFYSTYDVTAQVQAGANVLGVTLGNGWFNPLPLKFWGGLNLRQFLTIGRPCLKAQLALEYVDGSKTEIVSDTSWKIAEGPLLRNNIYLGEIYDARREIPGWNKPGFDDSAWKSAVLSPTPTGKLRSQMLPPIRVLETLPAQKITEPKPGLFIFDLGQNFTGVPRLRITAPSGTRITLRYGELLYKDGTLNVMTSVAGQIKRAGMGGPGAPPVAFASDVYICKGGGEEVYVPQFTFHGFRYIEVTGWSGRPDLGAIEGLVLSCDLESAGEFECSNELFNRIQQVCRRTFRSNLLGVQSDCPARERFGYGGDIAATSDALLLNYDMAAFYAKAVNDFADAADPEGWLTETAPFVGIADRGFGPRRGPIGWTVAYPILLRDLYRYTGNRRLVEENYDNARRYLELVRTKAPSFILTNCISDHESLDPKPEAALATAHYHQLASLVSDMAEILDRKTDAQNYRQLADQIQTAFVKNFLTNAPGKVWSGTQAAQATALFHDLLPPQLKPAALAFLEQAINQKRGRIATGIFGTKYILNVVSELGRHDLAYAMVSTKEFPGWGYMLENGATTLWETWASSDNVYSQDHPMFGSVSEWFFRHVAGLAPANDAVAFNHVILRPQPVEPGLTRARARFHSVRGPLLTNWRLDNGRFFLEVQLPPNVTATLYLPTTDPGSAKESNLSVAQSKGIKVLHQESVLILQLDSGQYSFEAAYLPARIR